MAILSSCLNLAYLPMAMWSSLQWPCGHPFNGHAVIPYHWFVRGKSILAHVWPLRLVRHNDSAGWIVKGFKTDIVSQDELLVLFGLWATSHLADGLPDAACIIGALLYVPS